MDAQNFYAEIGQNIRTFRKMSGMTQKQLAFSIQKSLACISKYEKGDISIDAFSLQKIADQFKVPVEQLLPRTESTHSHSEPDVLQVHPIFKNTPLYLYWYRDRNQPLIRHVIEIDAHTKQLTCFMEVDNLSSYKSSCKYMMCGNLYINGPNICIYATNSILSGDFIFLCFSPVDLLDSYMVGFLCCLNRSYHITASKCFISHTSLTPSEKILNAIMVKKDEVVELKKTNFFSFGTYRQE